MSRVQQLVESSRSDWKKQQSDAARIANKWSKTGLLKNLESDYDRNNMAMLLENQTKQLLTEQSQTGGAAIGGGDFSQEAWLGVSLPLVRKVFAKISSKDFVSVQTMNLPSGLVFYLDYKYDTAKSQFSDGDNMYGTLDVKDQDPTGGLYGPGRFGYSINEFSSSATLATGSAVTIADIYYDSSSNPATFAQYTFDFSSVDYVDYLGARAFRLYSASVDVTTNPAFTVADETNDTVTFVISQSAFPGGAAPDTFDAVVYYHKEPAAIARGDFEDTAAPSTSVPNANSASQIVIPEVKIELRSIPITAKTRKLKAQWTPEFAQDLNKYHSVDAEAEVTNVLGEYISLEIDLEILDMLILDARTTERWSASPNRFWTGTAWEDRAAGASGYYNTQGEWFQTLGTKVQKVSNKIHQKTLRGGANFMVVSPSVATILESIPGYAANTDGDKMEFAMGVQKVGQLNSRFQVYKNPYFTENLILMGFRGSQFLETGAVYAPYIPLMMTPLVYDPDTFTPRKGIMTRYAKKMIRPEFYGKIFISDLATV